jgi:uncharacterized membrane protein
VLAHYTNEPTHSGSLGALVAIAPIVLLALVLAWRSPRLVVRVGVPVGVSLALWAGWRVLEGHFGLIYWLQDVAILLVLFVVFARTLVADRQPLCTRFAEAVHAPLSPQHEAYARKVTIAWAAFFAAMFLVSTVLFFLAPITVWSVFANFLTMPLVAVMFSVEYWVRRRTLPNLQSAHILDAVRAFRKTSLFPR